MLPCCEGLSRADPAMSLQLRVLRVRHQRVVDRRGTASGTHLVVGRRGELLALPGPGAEGFASPPSFRLLLVALSSGVTHFFARAPEPRPRRRCGGDHLRELLHFPVEPSFGHLAPSCVCGRHPRIGAWASLGAWPEQFQRRRNGLQGSAQGQMSVSRWAAFDEARASAFPADPRRRSSGSSMAPNPLPEKPPEAASPMPSSPPRRRPRRSRSRRKATASASPPRDRNPAGRRRGRASCRGLS